MLHPKLSIVIPALNEEHTIKLCIDKAMKAFHDLKLDGEVIVADNGSTDGTTKIAASLGASVIHVSSKGYGSACMGGFLAAKGDYILMADADDSYSFDEIEPFIKKLDEGYDFVIGNRFKGGIEKGAMPFLHRYLGTPVLTAIMNLFFNVHIGDTNCGMRAFRRDALPKMGLTCTGMEFASEMVIRSARAKLKIADVPCKLYRDKRNRKPHLRTWHDGWRHLRFIIMSSPTWTFLIPGIFLCLLGMGIMAVFLFQDLSKIYFLAQIGRLHSLTGMLILTTGTQICWLGIIAKIYRSANYSSYEETSVHFFKSFFTVERALSAALSLILVGICIFGYLQWSFYWGSVPKFDSPIRFHLAVVAIAAFFQGIQVGYFSLIISLLLSDSVIFQRLQPKN